MSPDGRVMVRQCEAQEIEQGRRKAGQLSWSGLSGHTESQRKQVLLRLSPWLLPSTQPREQNVRIEPEDTEPETSGAPSETRQH